MTDSIPSDAYRRLFHLADPDSQGWEVSAEEYRAMQGGTANDLLRGLSTETPAKTEFGEWLDAVSPWPVLREHCGIPGRRFRFDWAVPEVMLAFEYDGINAAAHASASGVFRDSEKGNLAQIAGWMFIRVNARSLREETGYHMALDAFRARGLKA